MLILPPYGDHADNPVSSYKIIKILGDPSGAFFGINDVQSATEFLTSNSILPLKADEPPELSAVWELDGCVGWLHLVKVNNRTRLPANLGIQPKFFRIWIM